MGHPQTKPGPEVATCPFLKKHKVEYDKRYIWV
jgi:hypothetical protein